MLVVLSGGPLARGSQISPEFGKAWAASNHAQVLQSRWLFNTGMPFERRGDTINVRSAIEAALSTVSYNVTQNKGELI